MPNVLPRHLVGGRPELVFGRASAVAFVLVSAGLGAQVAELVLGYLIGQGRVFHCRGRACAIKCTAELVLRQRLAVLIIDELHAHRAARFASIDYLLELANDCDPQFFPSFVLLDFQLSTPNVRLPILEHVCRRCAVRYANSINPGQEKALVSAKRYAANFDEALLHGTSLIFCGTIGTCKTHLAVAIAHAVMARGRQAVFVKTMKAIDTVKETYSKGSLRTKGQVIRDFVEPDLLILDEAGMQRGTDEEKAILFEIIVGRYEMSRPTILTTNLALPALEEMIGERVLDRLREGNGRMVAFEWESHRRRRTA